MEGGGVYGHVAPHYEPIMSTRLQHHCLHDSSWELVPVGNVQNKLLPRECGSKIKREAKKNLTHRP